MITIDFVLLPSFLYMVENRMAFLIQTESVALLLLTVLSLVRLVNRIERTPEILNIIITLLFSASGTAGILIAIMRIYQNRQK